MLLRALAVIFKSCAALRDRSKSLDGTTDMEQITKVPYPQIKYGIRLDIVFSACAGCAVLC